LYTLLVLNLSRDSTNSGYQYTRDDPERNGLYGFVVISLGGNYYAAEQLNDTLYEYAFLDFRPDGIYRWDGDQEQVTYTIFMDQPIQNAIGSACRKTECEINSVSDLRKIMDFLIARKIPPHIKYKRQD